jgi:selenocysteine-specific elongation factor
MYIVGTSGHIDHGKTALIEALTGIDCDRLPEEKEREMTIDLGFAQIEFPKLGTVSVIDVPGHERFIRNMVAGAWGIDLALLVVAVDDGWMPQTEDHFRVLELLGIERLVAVLNKIDVADEEMISFVEEEVKERLSSTRYRDSEIVKVSARAGTGIDELKAAIRRNLEKLSKAQDADKPYLFIDRAFASKGYGTVITGTLKNGIFHDDDSVTLLPNKKESRIKRIESHNRELDEGSPSQRTALNLSGISLDEVRRGHIIVKKNFFTESSEIVAGIRLLDEKKKLKNNTGIEILAGTADLKGKLILAESAVENERFKKVRIKFDSLWHFYPGEPFIITNPGGYRIIGGGIVVLPDYGAVTDKKSLKNNLDLLKDMSAAEIIEFIIKINSAVKREDISVKLPASQKAVAKILSGIIDGGSVIETEGYLIDKNYYDISIKKIADVIQGNVGFNLKEISDAAAVNADVAKIVMPAVFSGHRIIEKDGRYFAGGSITADTLPADKKKALDFVRTKGLDGVEIDRENNDSLKKSIKELVRLGFLVSLDGNIIYHGEIYADLRKKVMALFNTRDKISVPEAKDATGLSRKYIIPLLNRIEGDGLIKRIGDFRMKT